MIELPTCLDTLFSVVNMMILPENINIASISQPMENVNEVNNASVH